MGRTVTAIRHVAFEGLGSFGPVLRDAGYEVRYVEAIEDDLRRLDPLASDLVVVLGGPIGAYEENTYPFLADEVRLLERRLRAKRPTLGICLGAQLIARALGARVYPGSGKEIGFAPITLTGEGLSSPLSRLGQNEVVLHWHGDTFDLPQDAERLASTSRYENQAFAVGASVLGLQFHPEIDAADIEAWLVGHAAELAGAGIDVGRIRSDARLHGFDVARRGAAFLERWINGFPDA